MIKYFCEKCNIECKTSECDICKKDEENKARIEKRKINTDNYKNIVKSKIYWCKNCNVPIYDNICSNCGEKGKYITTDLRPVFPEERLLLEILMDKPFKYVKDSVWISSTSKYIVNGERLKVTLKDLMKNNPAKVIDSLNKLNEKNTYEFFNNYVEKFINANKKRFNYITYESTEFIKKVSDGYDLGEMFISFSGGKDSTVIRDLVVKSLSKPEIIHIFGDTTLEFPLTLEYLKRFKKENKKSPVLIAKNKEKNFLKMGEILGPPSRVMRWCCTIFKTGAITRKINAIFRDKTRLLTFYGIRRSESLSRSKYDKVSESPKITKQRVASPIIDWQEFDIWLYILSTGIDFNDAYRLGYSRVGCWCCPNNSDWAQYLSSIYMPTQYNIWRNFLIEFAKKVGKPDPEIYVDQGKWKARQGGNGLKLSKNVFVSFKPCALEESSFNYELKKPISEDIYEFFKPFGWINKEMGNKRLGEVYVVDKNNNPIIRLQGKKGNNILKVSILKYPIAGAKHIRDARLKIECQLTKFQMCLGCLACESICKINAIKLKKHEDSSKFIYEIDNDKCIRCGECINHFDGGCYMRKVLITRKGD
ncbi:phosphoadenosine phosphosulfate reductase family protein [Clostridium novyi]|uniref:phosphoadenosine phosphosulfate reductase domain-containing protein n=1 Tax=Clostridium novyi TaxID=1542 RepID=UPI0009B80D49|nr:phosphoadenosine phosphosulfate reductase family protein [Clostridium novyi]